MHETPHRRPAAKSQLEGDPNQGSANSVNTDATNAGAEVVDFFSFDGEARDKPKPTSEIRRFQRPGDVPGDEPKAHRAMGTFNLGGLLEPDKMQPFEKLNRRLVPGDVPFDNPPLHHKDGGFTFGGLFRDGMEDVLMNQTVRMSCCRCIPGAPGWPPPSLDAPPPPSAGAAAEEPAASDEAEAAAGEAAAEGEPEPAAEEDEGAIPIVDAVPVEQAEPLDTGNETAATEAVPEGEAPPAEAAPGEEAPAEAPPEEEASPEEEATAGRRGAAIPGRGRRLLSVGGKAASGAARREALAQEAVGRLNEEYLMVKVPLGARPGDMFQAVSPVTGRTYAFTVPSVVPEDRLIRLQLPERPTPIVSVKLHHQGLDEEEAPTGNEPPQAEGQEPSPDEAAPADAAPAEPAPEAQPAAADAPAEEQPAAAAPAEEPAAAAAPAEEPAPEAAAEPPAAAAPAPSAGKVAGKVLGIAGRYAKGTLGYTAEGVPIGFGVGKSPPRATKFERCCYCPLYNTTTGDVMAWVPNPPKYPRRAAAAYAAMEASIEARHRHIEEVLGRTIDTYHRAEQVLRVAPPTPAPAPPPAEAPAPAETEPEPEYVGNRTVEGNLTEAGALDDGNATAVDGNVTDANATDADATLRTDDAAPAEGEGEPAPEAEEIRHVPEPSPHTRLERPAAPQPRQQLRIVEPARPAARPPVVQAARPAAQAERYATRVAAHTAPRIAAHEAPLRAAVAEPRRAPVYEPRRAPVAEPRRAPVYEPRRAPVAEPRRAPVYEPRRAPVAEPRRAPVYEPRRDPVAAAARPLSERVPQAAAEYPRQEVRSAPRAQQEAPQRVYEAERPAAAQWSRQPPVAEAVPVAMPRRA